MNRRLFLKLCGMTVAGVGLSAMATRKTIIAKYVPPKTSWSHIHGAEYWEKELFKEPLIVDGEPYWVIFAHPNQPQEAA